MTGNDLEQLKALIKGEIGRELVHLESVDSTNRVAMELGDKGASHGTVLIAESQTSGRGRLGRRWISPPGVNIYMSVVLRPVLKPEDTTLLTIMAANACAIAIRATTGTNIEIKWPNDLMVGDKKLGGILTEIKSFSGNITFAVIGIGINVSTELKDFPPDVRTIATSIREVASRRVRDEAASCPALLRSSLIAGILNEMDNWYGILVSSGRKPLLDEWRRLTSTLRRSVKVTVGEDVFTGTAEDIDESGMLILRLPSGTLKRISAGDVTVLQ